MTGEKNGVLNLITAATASAATTTAITTTATATATATATERTKDGSHFIATVIIKTTTTATTATATTPFGVILVQIQVFHKENVGAPFEMTRQGRTDKQLSREKKVHE